MAGGQAIAPISIETKTIQKVRLRILPFVFLFYVVSYLDRINIGFAALTMNKELGITSQQFGLLAGIFFFGYFFFEIPSNLLLHKIGARIWIARILITWGLWPCSPASCTPRISCTLFASCWDWRRRAIPLELSCI